MKQKNLLNTDKIECFTVEKKFDVIIQLSISGLLLISRIRCKALNLKPSMEKQRTSFL